MPAAVNLASSSAVYPGLGSLNTFGLLKAEQLLGPCSNRKIRSSSNLLFLT